MSKVSHNNLSCAHTSHDNINIVPCWQIRFEMSVTLENRNVVFRKRVKRSEYIILS